MPYGTLYLCATPIGNLQDITLRVLDTLKTADLIACEDTRKTLQLLNHFSISKPVTSYYEHNKTVKGDVIIQQLKECWLYMINITKIKHQFLLFKFVKLFEIP